VELGVLFLTGLLLIFFVLRPLLKAATGGSGAPGQPALAGPGGMTVTALQTTLVGGAAPAPGMPQLAGPSDMEHRLDIARIEGQVKASSVKKVADFVDSHPEESVSILRSWVHES
jgi:flagellar M-ring protein FliF